MPLCANKGRSCLRRIDTAETCLGYMTEDLHFIRLDPAVKSEFTALVKKFQSAFKIEKAFVLRSINHLSQRRARGLLPHYRGCGRAGRVWDEDGFQSGSLYRFFEYIFQ